MYSKKVFGIYKICLSEFLQALANAINVVLSFDFGWLKLFDLGVQLFEYDGSIVG